MADETEVKPDGETPVPAASVGPGTLGEWLRELPRALVYPLRMRGVIFLLVGGVVWGLADALPFPFSVVTAIVAWVLIAFLYAYLFNMVQNSAGGEDELPPLPIGKDLVDDGVIPVLYVGVTLVLCYLPLLVSVNLQSGSDFLLVLIGLISSPYMFEFESPDVYLAIAGTVYLPMALLAVAVHRDVRAVSPHVVVPAVIRVLFPYACVTLLFLGVTTLHNHIMGELTTSFWLGDSDSSLSWMFGEGNRAVIQFVLKPCLLYVYAVLARALGMIHWVYRKRLGWLKRV